MSAPAPLRLSPAECTCFRVRGAARRVTQIYSRHLAPTGLKISQFSLLGFVAARGPVSITELSEMLTVDCHAPLHLAHRFLPGLKARGKGALLMVSSIEALIVSVES